MALEGVVRLSEQSPFRPRFNHRRIEDMFNSGALSMGDLEDVGVLAWANSYAPSHNKAMDFHRLSYPFHGVSTSQGEPSFIEKVAASVTMLGFGLDGAMTGRGSGYGHRDYLTTDFDYEMQHGTKGIANGIKEDPHNRRIRANQGHRSTQPFFAIFNFRDETTQLFGYDSRPESELTPFERAFEGKEKVDLVAPFSIFPTFPFYGVSQITLLRGEQGTQYSHTGKKEVSIPREFFTM